MNAQEFNQLALFAYVDDPDVEVFPEDEAPVDDVAVHGVSTDVE